MMDMIPAAVRMARLLPRRGVKSRAIVVSPAEYDACQVLLRWTDEVMAEHGFLKSEPVARV